VVVLVNHWSASMAEGFPMGMQGMHRARIVGTRMMGLGAGVSDVVLGWTQIPVQVSAEPVFHVDGTARWHLQPDVRVDLTAPTNDDDPILAAGLRTLAARGAATNTP
jgi:carboxyl-terminal processing protease